MKLNFQKLKVIFEEFNVKLKKKIHEYIIITNILIKIIIRINNYFTHFYYFKSDKNILILNTENLHCAYCFLYTWSRQNKKTQKNKKKIKLQNNLIKNVHYFSNTMKDTQLTDDINIIFSNKLIAYKVSSESSSNNEEFFKKNIVQFLKTHWKSKSLINYIEHMTELSAMIKKKQTLLIKYAKNHLNIQYNK